MSRVITLAGYIVLAGAAIALELRARRRGTATFADAITHALRWPPARLAVLAAWLWWGWHIFVRVSP